MDITASYYMKRLILCFSITKQFFQTCNNTGGTWQGSRLLQDHVELHGPDDQILQRIRICGRARKRKLSHDQSSAKTVDEKSAMS